MALPKPQSRSPVNVNDKSRTDRFETDRAEAAVRSELDGYRDVCTHRQVGIDPPDLGYRLNNQVFPARTRRGPLQTL